MLDRRIWIYLTGHLFIEFEHRIKLPCMVETLEKLGSNMPQCICRPGVNNPTLALILIHKPKVNLVDLGVEVHTPDIQYT